jgi:transketolase
LKTIKKRGTKMDVAMKKKLKSLCRELRMELIEQLYKIQTGHPGGSLSATEILVSLYFNVMNVKPEDPHWADRDRFVLSKGHAAPMLYLILAKKGFFPMDELKTLRQINSILQGHPCAHSTPGIEVSSGPLGLGISAATGMAAAAKLDGKSWKTYVLLGDGEIQEGIVWEAAQSASKFKLDNLIAILDWNGVQLDGPVESVMPSGDIAAKWSAFGWRVIKTDGHDLECLDKAIETANDGDGRPTIILAKTIKGKGVSFMEGQNKWHGSPIDEESYKSAIKELKEGGDTDA